MAVHPDDHDGEAARPPKESHLLPRGEAGPAMSMTTPVVPPPSGADETVAMGVTEDGQEDEREEQEKTPGDEGRAKDVYDIFTPKQKGRILVIVSFSALLARKSGVYHRVHSSARIPKQA